MKIFKNHPALAAATLFYRSLAIFPIWLAFLLLCKINRFEMLAGCGILLLFSLFLNILSYSSPLKQSILYVLSFLSTLLPAYLLSKFHVNPLAGILLSIITMLITLHKPGRDLAELFSVNQYVFFLTGILANAVLLLLTKQKEYFLFLVAGTAIVSCGFFLLRNQFMLLRMVNRRSEQHTEVPHHIRNGNLLLIVGNIVGIALLLLLYKPIGKILTWCVARLGQLTVFLLRLFRRCIHHLGGAAPDAPTEPSPELPPPTIQGETAWYWYLLWIPVIVTILLFLYTLVRNLVWSAQDYWSARQKRKKHPEKHTAEQESETDFKKDTETIVGPAGNGAWKRKHQWKKALRAWQKLPNSTEKFYAGYRLILTAPAWGAHPPRASETVQEILLQWNHQKKDTFESLQAVTQDFHIEHYAEKNLPDHAQEDIADTLRKLLKAQENKGNTA